MKILHTADVHLDRCFTGTGMPARMGNIRRQSLRDVFSDTIQRAADWPADILLIAGDLFEHDRVTRDTLAFLMAQFNRIPNTQVFIAPGNHDPCLPNSPYITEIWPPNVHIFSRPEWESRVACKGAVTVHGFGFDAAHITRNPFGQLWIEEARQDQLHIAVAHGSEKSHQPPDKEDYAPFLAQDVAVPGLDYLALGHFHGLQEIEGDFGTRIFYPGSPEGLSFKEKGLHHFLEIELEDGKLSVNPVPSSRIIYIDETLFCDEFNSSQEVIETIRALAQSLEARVIGRITLTGACDAVIKNEMGLIHDATAIEFDYLELSDQTAPIEDYDELAQEDTSIGLFVSTLNREIAEAPDAARVELLERARELGVAGFRDRNVEIRGLERG